MNRDYTNLPADVRNEQLETLRKQAEGARNNAASHRKLAGQHQAGADRENEYADRDEERARQWQKLLDLACEAIPLGEGTEPPDDDEPGYTDAQFDGTACVTCDGEFGEGERTYMVAVHDGAQLFAHRACAESEAGR